MCIIDKFEKIQVFFRFSSIRRKVYGVCMSSLRIKKVPEICKRFGEKKFRQKKKEGLQMPFKRGFSNQIFWLLKRKKRDKNREDVTSDKKMR